MKMPARMFSLFLVIALCVPLVCYAEINFSNYSLNELIALKTQITSEITARTAEKKSVLVPMGEYIIGVDIPAGIYSLTLSSDITYAMISIYSSEKKLIGSYALLESSNRNTVGKIEFQDGQRIEIDYGPIMFVPYKGLEF